MAAQGLAMLLHITVNLPDSVTDLFPNGVDRNFPWRVLYPSLPPEG